MHVNEESEPETLTAEGTGRRSLLTAIAASVGGATLFGPGKENRVWAQAAQPLDVPKSSGEIQHEVKTR